MNLFTVIGFFTAIGLGFYLCRVVWLQAAEMERLRARVAELEARESRWRVTEVTEQRNLP